MASCQGKAQKNILQWFPDRRRDSRPFFSRTAYTVEGRGGESLPDERHRAKGGYRHERTRFSQWGSGRSDLSGFLADQWPI